MQPTTGLSTMTPDGRIDLRFHPGQWAAWNSTARVVVVLAGKQSGKCLDVDTPIPTPEGFRPLSELQVGDQVFSRDGHKVLVTYVSPVYLGNTCYRLTFDDGATLIADAEHLWKTSTHLERRAEGRPRVAVNARADRPQCRRSRAGSGVRTTEQIVGSLHTKNGYASHSIELCSPVKFLEKELPLGPYTFGAWLGDGRTTGNELCSADPQIIQEIRSEGYRVGPGKECNGGKALGYNLGYTGTHGGAMGLRRTNVVRQTLRDMGANQDKCIPTSYLFGSVDQRLSFLQGLMDTDGCCSKNGHCEFGNRRRHIADAVDHLAKSLGIKTRFETKDVDGKPFYNVYFTTDLPVFRLQRKLDRLKLRRRNANGGTRVKHRFIVSVEQVPSVPVRCITVDASDHLYLVGTSFIPTHNTVMGPPWMAREIAQKGPGDYLVVGPTYKLLDKKVVPEFTRLFQAQCRWGRFTGGSSMCFRFSPYGEQCLFGTTSGLNLPPTKVFFGHAQDPDSLASSTAKAAWLDEAGMKRFKLGSYEEVIARLAVHQGRTLVTTTPYGGGWFKELCDRCTVLTPMGKVQPHRAWKMPTDRVDTEMVPAAMFPPPLTEVVRFESIMNPTFPQEEYEEARRTMPSWKFDLAYRAIFTRPAGVIYDCFDVARHRVQPFDIPDHWPRYLGLDFGGVHTAGVLLAAELDGTGHETGKLYLYREYPAAARWSARPSWEHVRELRKGERVTVKMGNRQTTGTVDAQQSMYVKLIGGKGDPPGSPFKRAVGGSKSEDKWREEFRASGINVMEPPVAEVEVGIDRVYAAIKADQLYVFSSCVGVLDELESYSRELDERGEPTEKIEDAHSYHYCDSIRYVCSYLKGGKREAELW